MPDAVFDRDLSRHSLVVHKEVRGISRLADPLDPVPDERVVQELKQGC